MVLSVLSLIQFGTDLFCFSFTARVRFVRKVLCEGMVEESSAAAAHVLLVALLPYQPRGLPAES